MGIHFKPSVDPGQAIDPNISYINFSTFLVNTGTLKQRIEAFYGDPECSFPLTGNFKMQTQANIATDLDEIRTLAGVGPDQGTGIPTISGYDAEGDIGEDNILSNINTDTPPNGVDFAGPMTSRYRRVDVTDALFSQMNKRIFEITPVLICQTPDQCLQAYHIIHYFHQMANPSLIELENKVLKVAPPFGFAVWASDRAPQPITTDNYFPVINHSFLARILLTSADSGQSLSPYTILNSQTDEQHPLKIQLSLTFVEIQPAYKSEGENYVRNRSAASRASRSIAVTTTTTIS